MKKTAIVLAIIFSTNLLAVGSDGSNKSATQICYKKGDNGPSIKSIGADGSNSIGADGSNRIYCQIIPIKNNNF